MAGYDVVVIGSGAGGLSAALKVARSGYKALLLEAMPSFGGYLNPFHRRGYTFDAGLHYVATLAEGETFWRLLEELGVRKAIEFLEIDPDGFDRFVFPDYEFALCKGKERFRERLIQAFPREERGINRFFEILRQVIEATTASRSMGDGPFAMLGFLLKHPVMLKYSRIPYQKLLDEVTSDRRLQAVLAGQSGTYGLPPARASVLIVLMALNYYLSGAYYPKGGSGALRDAFLNALRTQGAEMKSSARVSRITKERGDFLVVTESGEQYPARVVISNADPAITLGKLVDAQIVPTKIRERVGRLRPSMGACCAFIGTDLDLPAHSMTSANIQHYENLDVNRVFEALNAATLQERMPFCFISSASLKDPQGGHAPEGRHTVEIVTCAKYEDFQKWASLPVTKRGEEYDTLKKKIGRQLVTTAERYLPGLSQHLDVVEYSTPLSNEHWVNAVRGGMYGPEQTPDQMGKGRFSACTSGVDGLFLAGAGAIAAGVNACVASGLIAGRKAVEYLLERGTA
jgi:all-trans-retinol 13,14-reductase